MILMQLEFMNDIKFLVGNKEDFVNVNSSPCSQPFNAEVIDFLQDLSNELMDDRKAKQYSDIVTFAFWCRKSSVLTMKKKYYDLDRRKGRGLSFHISPSNIPVMFAFSLAASMLGGNSNIVRISSRIFPQTNIICSHINRLFNRCYQELGKSNFIINYPHDAAITDYLSKICDSRIIWGGNNSIMSIRKSPLKASAIEIPFYDRFSMALIDIDTYLNESNKEMLAEKFYIDTYFFDQNACSSPQLVCWYGGSEESFENARTQFWNELKKIVGKKYEFQSIQGVDKQAAADRYLIRYGDGKISYTDMSLMTVLIEELHEDLKDYRCPGGYFYEYHVSDLHEIHPVCTVDCQTIAYYGIERQEIIKAVSQCRGVDRVVPFGNTMDFGLVWDGFDFITSLSKLIG